MRLILVRHGETRLNRDLRVLGRGDFPLTDLGRRQARALAEALRGELPFPLYSSPVARAWETATIIAEALGVKATALEELAEADAGLLEGLTGEEFRRRFPDFVRQWERDPATARMPEGECLLEVQARAWRAVEGLAQLHPEGTVVAVTHHFVIVALLCRVLDMPLRHFNRLRQEVASITRLELADGTGRVLSLNDTCHLKGLTESP